MMNEQPQTPKDIRDRMYINGDYADAEGQILATLLIAEQLERLNERLGQIYGALDNINHEIQAIRLHSVFNIEEKKPCGAD